MSNCAVTIPCSIVTWNQKLRCPCQLYLPAFKQFEIAKANYVAPVDCFVKTFLESIYGFQCKAQENSNK